jgi:hypothetical protein
MSRLDEVSAEIATHRAAVQAAGAQVQALREEIAETLPPRRPDPLLVAALRRAIARLATVEAALDRAEVELDALLAAPVAGLAADHPVALLPVRIETRFVTDDVGAALLVRIYPDEVHVDDHEPELTDGEVVAATRYWERIWRAGRGDVDAERSAFAELCGRVGVTRGLWVAHATRPDDTDRPVDPVPDGSPLPVAPVLPQVPRADTGFSRAAVTRVLPDQWVVVGYRGTTRVLRAVGTPVRDPLTVGPSPEGRPPAGGDRPPLEESVLWLADFDAAVAAGMGIRIPLAEERGLDRLLVLGVRSSEDPAMAAQRLHDLLDGQRYTSGLGFVPVGSPTNNTGADRSGWSRRDNAAEAFDADRSRDVPETANAAATAAAFGVSVDAFAGVAHAARGDSDDARALHRALWPATIGYFLETLMHPSVDDATVEAVRDLFIAVVRGLGPLPTLRVGSQPYGVLPVTALGRWRPASRDEAAHGRLVELLRRLAPEWLAATRAGAPRAVPHAGSDADPEQELLDILARDALSGSYRLRPVRGGLTARAVSHVVAGLDAAGEALADAAHRLAGGGAVLPRLARFQFDPRTARVRRAPVLSGPLSEIDPVPGPGETGLNYLAFLAARREQSEAFAGPGASSLLFKLALHACQLADADAAIRITQPASVVAAKVDLEPEVVDPVPGRVSATATRLLARPAREVIGGQLPAGQSVGEFLATATPADVAALGLPHVRAAFRRTTEVRRALGSLAGVPSAQLDRLTRATLDVCSHRLDAWMTAYATRRLADVRQLHPTGVHLGGYGWVDNLFPEPAPRPVLEPPAGETGPLVTDAANAGYVVAPSLTQAATAALLLSGHLTHRGGSGPAAEAFAIDLSSDRVRLAKWLLDGVRQGQPLGALLGYRFERGLHDRSRPGLELDQFIRPFRALAPLVAGRLEEVPATIEAVEAVAASNVVDGLSLLTRFQDDPAFINPALAGADAAQRQAVRAELAALADAADALADLMTAETTYQLASGNVARAAATLDGLGSGVVPPPEPEVVRTPRPGFAYTHRLVALAGVATGAPPGWAAGADRPRRLAEPRLDRWVARLLGPADRIRAALRVVGPDGAVADRREVTVADIGACALDLVYDANTLFELEVADHVTDAPTGGRVEVVHRDDGDWPGADWPADVLPLDDALEQARWLAEAVGSARPLTAADLTTPGGTPAAGIVRADLTDRLDRVAARYRSLATELVAARDALAAAPSLAAVARVRSALRGLAAFGLPNAREAVHDAAASDEDPGGQLAAAADAAIAETTRVLAQVDQPDAGGGPAVPPEAAALRAMLGATFVVVPLIEPPGAAWSDTLAGGAAPEFLAGDPAAPLAWLQRVARVRPQVDRYLCAVAGRSGRWAVAQTPVAPRWVGLPVADTEEPPPSATSVIVNATGAEATASTLAGLVIDEWTDVVPAGRTTAGVGFHFDEPGARAPQAVLLAVPPELGVPWSLETLADIVRETADLARIRMVGPEETPWLGRYLPALYVADNPEGDTLTVDLRDLVVRAEGDGP